MSPSPSGRTRVLHVIQNLHYGGMERLIAEIARLCDRDRFETHVLGIQYLGRFADDMGDVATCHVGPPMTSLSMLRPKALAKTLAEIAPDVIHSHSGVWYKASLAARMAGIRNFIHTDHGRTFPVATTERFLDGLAFRRTTTLVAVSAELARNLTATNPRFEERMEVIPNGVDTDVFRPRSDNGVIRSELGLPTDVPIIGSIGRLEHVKGYDVAVEALAVLHRATPDGTPKPVLVVGGDGDEMPGLREQAARLGVADHVRLLSWRDDIEDLLRSFTFFTMSSRSEGTSVSLLEAMSAGLCPVVTDVGGNRAALGEELGHRLVVSEGVTELAEAWRVALTESTARERDAEVARQQVIDRFALRRMVDAYQRLYEA